MEKPKPFKQKTAVLEKLYKNGYTDRKKLAGLTLEKLGEIKDLNFNDVSIISEIVKSIRNGTFFAYLGEEWAEKEENNNDGTKDR
ncbi:MAG: hypothetical protein E7571_00115 [Ruminococcaceae bacterium]|nr:hypothetical protein [Oscillospiraceae bacterium]